MNQVRFGEQQVVVGVEATPQGWVPRDGHQAEVDDQRREVVDVLVVVLSGSQWVLVVPMTQLGAALPL